MTRPDLVSCGLPSVPFMGDGLPIADRPSLSFSTVSEEKKPVTVRKLKARSAASDATMTTPQQDVGGEVKTDTAFQSQP